MTTLDLTPFEKFAADGWHWSVGTHPQWRFDARIWRYEIDPVTGKRTVPTRIGIGNTLEEAVAMLLTRPKWERKKTNLRTGSGR